MPVAYCKLFNVPKRLTCCPSTNKTKWERDLFHAAYDDLERRRADGESDLIVVHLHTLMGF